MPAPRTTARPTGSTSRTAPRPARRTDDARALREAVLLRQVLAARPDLTPEQAVRLVAAAAARSGTTATGTGRTGAGRSRRRRAPRARTEPRWSTRLGVVAMSALLLPVAVVLALPAGTDRDDDPSGGPVDVHEAALSTKASLMARADRYRVLEQQIADRRAWLQQAEDVVATIEAQVEAQQQVLGAAAADLYRAAPAQRYPLLGLSVHDRSATDAALHGQAVVELADRDLGTAVVRAQRTQLSLQDAHRQVAGARAAVEQVLEEADGVLRLVRAEVDQLSPAVTGTIAGLSALPAPEPQRARNAAATGRWQAYLAQLAAAGVEPPSAAALDDPDHLPPGFSPALTADARPVPGVAWTVIGNSPVTVLPAETVAAVSTALSQLGKPFVPQGRGPDVYDCGGFTSAAWLLAGHAIPATPQEQWARGIPVAAADLQIGDLVFSADGADVGIYLGAGDVISASVATYQVGVRDLAAGSHGVRVPLGAPTQPNDPLTGSGTTGPCGAPLPSPERVTSPAWGGWANGRIPADALCEIGVHRHALRCDAATSYRQLADAFTAAFGTPLCITDSYRSLETQISAFYAKPALAAVPGTSNHGWGLAVDLCGGINVGGTPQWTWMTQHAARFGFVQPDWAGPAGEKPEPWHWEFGYLS